MLRILIPPSEGKQLGGSSPALKKPSPMVKPIISLLEKVKDDQWGKLLGVKDKALAQAINANQHILTSATMPAIKRYTGVVYSAIDYPTLNAKATVFFNKHVRIISAIFGLVAPTDLIPDYKLKIDKLGTDKYWKPIIADQLKNYYVIDLLPQAHRKAVKYTDGIALEFIILKNGNKIPAGHSGKHIKGRFVRWLCEHQITNPHDFKKFKEDGFIWQDGIFIKS